MEMVMRSLFVLFLSFLPILHAQSMWDLVFPCEEPDCLEDPCAPCGDSSLCETNPTTVRAGFLGWRTCPGCPVLDRCIAKEAINDVCCDSANRCTNCTCCSDGNWVLDNSDSSPELFCGQLSLEQGEECQYYACTKDLKICDDGTAVGREFTDPDCPFKACPAI